MNIIDEYENYIQKFSNLNFTMDQLHEDNHFQTIIKEIVSNNNLLQEAINKIPEFKYAYIEHFDNDNNMQLNGNKIFIHAPSPMASFLTSLIMGRFH